MARLVRALEWAAAAGWVASLGLTVTRVLAPGDQWIAPLTPLALAVAGTCTVSVGILHAVPAAFRAWERGVEHGRVLERAETLTEYEVPRPRLRPVR